MSKNFDLRQYVSSPRKANMRERRETTKDCRGHEQHSLCVASSSAASFPGRNECPGTHCSLIEQEGKEDSFCQRD